MRRLLAYVSLAASVVLGIGVTANAVLTKVKSDNTFSDGKTITFKLSEKDSEDIFESEVSSKDAAEEVAEEMSSRLKTWGVTSYKVTAIGSDTIEATFTAKNDDEYKDISRYLRFSGQNYSLSNEDDTINFSHEEMFKDSKARIEYEGYAPIVVVPVSDAKTLKSQVDEKAGQVSTEDGEENSGVTLYLWANREEGDTYEEANENPDVQDKFVMAFSSNNLWYAHSEEENTEIQYICGSATEEGYYDTKSTSDAYYTANKYVNLLNASELDYKITELYSVDVEPSVESLVNLGKNSVTLAKSRTLIASLIAVVMISLVLVLFYKVGAISTITTSLTSVYATLLVFVLTGSEFNIAAIVGFILVAALSIFAGVHYSTKAKEEIYRGKSMRKANIEASKRNTMIVLDSSIVSIAFGVMLFIMGGNFVAPMGFILAVGGLINLLVNGLLLKLMNYLVYNSTKLQKNYKAFNIEDKFVLNPLEDNTDKLVYQSPYQEKDFTKKKKIVGILAGVFAAATLAVSIAFSVVKGSAYSLSTSSANSRIYITVDTNSAIESTDFVKDSILKAVFVKDGEDFVSITEFLSDVDHESGTIYNKETKLNDEYDYYVVKLNAEFNSDSEENAKWLISEGNWSDVGNINDIIQTVCEKYDSYAKASVKTEQGVASFVVKASALWASLIAVGICAVYFAIRYGISKALAAIITSVLSGGVTLGLFIVTRIPCTEIVTLAGIFIAVFALITMIYYFSKEKELRKEVNTRHQAMSKEEKHNIMIKSLGISASMIIAFTLICAYLAINYFGFASTAFGIMFGGMIFGIILAALFITTLCGPTSELFEGWFSKIRIKPRDGIKKAKKHAAKQKQNRSAEPEESPVIGINI